MAEKRFDLTTIAAADGLCVIGDASSIDLSAAGDLNIGGLENVIVGAFGADDGGTSAAEAQVIFGEVEGLPVAA